MVWMLERYSCSLQNCFLRIHELFSQAAFLFCVACTMTACTTVILTLGKGVRLGECYISRAQKDFETRNMRHRSCACITANSKEVPHLCTRMFRAWLASQKWRKLYFYRRPQEQQQQLLLVQYTVIHRSVSSIVERNMEECCRKVAQCFNNHDKQPTKLKVDDRMDNKHQQQHEEETSLEFEQDILDVLIIGAGWAGLSAGKFY